MAGITNSLLMFSGGWRVPEPKNLNEITQFISVCSKKTNLSLATLNLGKSTREWSEPQTPPAQDLSP